MITILQRVREARVEVAGEVVGQIGPGLLALVCAERGDTEAEAGKMNRSVQDIGGGLLLVSQFTLAADTTTGNRPGFSQAAAPEDGRRLFDYFVAQARAAHPVVQTGRFATEMQVYLVNDGPVTIPLRIAPALLKS